jgi:hypothetical protein
MRAVAEQEEVYESVRQHAVRPLLRAGWDVALLVDASFQDAAGDGTREQALRSACTKLGARHVRLNAPMQVRAPRDDCTPHRRLGLQTGGPHPDPNPDPNLDPDPCGPDPNPGPAPVQENQRLGWLETIGWATALEPEYAALLVLRNDLRLKAELAFPSPAKLAADPAVLVPWHHRSNYNTTPEPDHTPHGGKRVTDTFMLVPRPLLPGFLAFLSAVPYEPTWTQFSLHDIADPVHGMAGGKVRVLDETARESDSGKAWNPLYELVGRHVSQYGKAA